MVTASPDGSRSSRLGQRRQTRVEHFDGGVGNGRGGQHLGEGHLDRRPQPDMFSAGRGAAAHHRGGAPVDGRRDGRRMPAGRGGGIAASLRRCAALADRRKRRGTPRGTSPDASFPTARGKAMGRANRSRPRSPPDGPGGHGVPGCGTGRPPRPRRGDSGGLRGGGASPCQAETFNVASAEHLRRESRQGNT